MGLSDRILPPEDGGAEYDELRREAAEYVPPMDDDVPELPPASPGEDWDVDVAVAVRRARRDMGIISKRERYDDKKGTRYNYRGVDRVVNAARPVLERHGIWLLPSVASYEQRDIARQTGGRSGMSIVTMEYWIYGPRGDCMERPVRVIGEAMDTSDKDAAKAQSVAWRVALIQLLHIATGDPDPDSTRIDRGDAPEFDALAYREEALNPGTSVGRLSQMIHEMKSLGKGDILVENETGDEEKIGNLVWRVRKERAGGGGGERGA